MLHIDGSQGEGGGQILRTALSLSSLLQQPITIENIRANRKKPGLRPQHLQSLKAIAEITDAEMSGAQLNARQIVFKPRMPSGGTYHFDIGTAGSLSSLLLFFLRCFSLLILQI